eukprot:g116.t1
MYSTSPGALYLSIRYASSTTPGSRSRALSGTPKTPSKAFKPPDSSHFLGKYAPRIVIGYLLLGATAFWLFERGNGWEWWDGAYFATVTLTTVGYGDLAPTSAASKLFCVFYILTGLSLVASSVGMMSASVEEKVESEEAKLKSGSQKRFLTIVTAIATLLALALTGTLFLHFNEGHGWVDSVYWSFVTLSSVGYGDITTNKESTRIFLIFYILLGVALTASSLGEFAKVWMEAEEEKHMQNFITRGVSEAMIMEIDDSGEGSVDKWEFMSYMLVKLGKLKRADILQMEEVFNLLDQDGSGEIDLDDVRRSQQLRRAQKMGFGLGGGKGASGGGGAGKAMRLNKMINRHRGSLRRMVNEGAPAPAPASRPKHKRGSARRREEMMAEL